MKSTRIETRNPANARLARLLRLRIEDLHNLEVMAEQAHWEVSGPNHVALHGLFEQIRSNMSTHEAELAAVFEELGSTGRSAIWRKARAHPLTPYSEHGSSGHRRVTNLSNRLTAFHHQLLRMRGKLTTLGNAHASAACTALVQDVDKFAQSLKNHLQSVR